MLTSQRLYYRWPWQTEAESAWELRGPAEIALSQSIAYPEGGGQLGDTGVVLQGGIQVRFTDTQKVFGRTVFRKDFPAIQVEGEVRLFLTEAVPSTWNSDTPIRVIVDLERRAGLVQSHSAAHLVYIGLMKVVDELETKVIGCRVDPGSGRFDLRDVRLSQEDLKQVSDVASDWHRADYPIVIGSLPDEPECRIWHSNGVDIPCGGLHLPRTGLVGSLTLRRKSQGKGVERIYYSLGSEFKVDVCGLFGNPTQIPVQ